MLEKIKKLHYDENGDIVQTAIITALLAILAVGGITFLGPKVKSLFKETGEQLDDAADYSY